MKLLQYTYCLFWFCQITHTGVVYADDTMGTRTREIVVEIRLQNHLFSPTEIHVPAHKKIILVVHNLDSTVEEFDSPSLKREKLLKSNSTTHIILAPLMPGRYDFIGEFYQDTAKGTVIVEE